MKPSIPIFATLTVLALAGALACGSQDEARRAGTAGTRDTASDVPLPDSLCADRSAANQLCPFVPRDVDEQFQSPVGYGDLAAFTQRPFDTFSWQTFVALNWPADSAGNPIGSSLGDSATAFRVWEMYPSTDEVFGTSGLTGCGASLPKGTHVLRMMAKNGDDLSGGDIKEATGQPLIDRNGNYALYEIRMDTSESNYITTNGLNTAQGQVGKTVSFPYGYYTDSLHTGGPIGAIEVKAVWRILMPQEGDDTTRYYHHSAVIYVAKENSASGQALCITATVGLVAIHIIHKTQNQQRWVWSSFEHVDLAPTCATGQGDCGRSGTTYSFYNSACPTTLCVWNQPPAFPSDSIFLWNSSPPYAGRYAFYDTTSTSPLKVDTFGTQVVRTDSVFAETDSVTASWQLAVANTVWRNYRLIGSQWANPEAPPTTGAGIPTILGNSALETYIPSTSSCTLCHMYATDAAGLSSDFSYVLGFAPSDTSTLYFRGTPIRRTLTAGATANANRPFTKNTPIPRTVKQ